MTDIHFGTEICTSFIGQPRSELHYCARTLNHETQERPVSPFVHMCLCGFRWEIRNPDAEPDGTCLSLEDARLRESLQGTDVKVVTLDQ